MGLMSDTVWQDFPVGCTTQTQADVYYTACVMCD